jgi:hypothetical protein
MKRSGQNTPDEKWSDSPPLASERIEDTESIAQLAVVDAATERRLLRKLDMRIIPMICWIYLMNFMDRGEYSLGLKHCAYTLTRISKHR